MFEFDVVYVCVCDSYYTSNCLLNVCECEKKRKKSTRYVTNRTAKTREENVL